MAIIKNKSARLADKTRKELHKCLDLNNGKFKPYRKPNDDPLYINRLKNHPPSIKQLPTSINKCISALLADEQTFHESAPIYQNALRHINFDHKLDYMKQAPQKNTQKQATQDHLV